VNARNRVFLILVLLTVGSLIWYLATVRPSTDLQLIGTVDANEVLVSAKIPGRIQTLTVDEGQQVKAGQLIAVIESEDLQAARAAAEARARRPAPLFRATYAPAMIPLRNATWRAKAARPARLALTVVRGRLPTKALATST